MRLGLMQPYFFPYFEYFRLIDNCSLWVHFDTAQYSRGSWQNRNRILDRNKGWTYIGVPIARDGLETSIKNARIDARQNWRKQFLNKLKIYENTAPHYQTVSTVVGDILSEDYASLADLNAVAIQSICQLLGINTPTMYLSEMSISPPQPGAPGGWPLHLCKHLGASEYRNSSSGHTLYDPDTFRHEGVELSFHQHTDLKYDTGQFTFVPDLSIIDVMMWVDTQTLKDVISSCRDERVHTLSQSASGRRR